MREYVLRDPAVLDPLHISKYMLGCLLEKYDADPDHSSPLARSPVTDRGISIITAVLDVCGHSRGRSELTYKALD